MATDRTEYQRAYYEAHKAEKKAKRKPQPRTTATIAAEKRYREMRARRSAMLWRLDATTYGEPRLRWRRKTYVLSSYG